MPHTYSRILLLVVFSTKNRRPSLNGEITSRLFPYMGGIIRESDAKMLAVNGTTDHVHLLLSLPTGLSITDLMRTVKTRSSKWIHETMSGARSFAWQPGCGAFSVSESNVEQVKQYIADQEEHHRKVSFMEECLMLLRKHSIEFDEEMLWK